MGREKGGQHFMSQRFSKLSPLPIELAGNLTLELIGFFGVLNAKHNATLLGKAVDPNQITPLSVNDFFEYMKKIKGLQDVERYRFAILQLVKRLEQEGLLTFAGTTQGYSMGGERCYYYTKEITKVQATNLLWLGEALGLEYVQHKTRPFVVPITGMETSGDVGIGTGTLINKNTILTCGHVLNDMRLDKTVQISGKDIEIASYRAHDSMDVGIIRLTEEVNLGFSLPLGEAMILDEILTMGYPPVPMTRDCYLISQKGEVNSVVQNYDGVEHFVYSSITRPGNSGGPIFSRRGHIVGITTQHVEKETDKERNVVPFFQGITAREVIRGIHEIDPTIEVVFEDYN